MKKIFFYPNETVVCRTKIVKILEKIKRFFKKNEVEIIRRSLIDKKNLKNYIQKFVLAKISNLYSENQPDFIFEQELDFEKNFLLHNTKNTQLYDAFKLQEIYKELIKYKLKECHIVFTNRIIATFDNEDKRYHARVVLLGYPNVISITGLYYALALPKQEYLKKFLGQITQDDRKIKVGENLEKFLLKYILQCFMYSFYNEIFCSYKNCLCYDNHFFDEVFEQIKKIKFNKLPLCKKHERMLSTYE